VHAHKEAVPAHIGDGHIRQVAATATINAGLADFPAQKAYASKPNAHQHQC
jgi:subtilase family serine protease